jgi:hypothetical protein
LKNSSFFLVSAATPEGERKRGWLASANILTLSWEVMIVRQLISRSSSVKKCAAFWGFDQR